MGLHAIIAADGSVAGSWGRGASPVRILLLFSILPSLLKRADMDVTFFPSLTVVAAHIEKITAQMSQMELSAMATRVGVRVVGLGSAQWANQIFEKIEAAIDPDRCGARAHVKRLLSEHLFAYQLDGAPFDPVMGVLQVIHSTRAPVETVGSGVSIDWDFLVEAAYVYSKLSPGWLDENTWPRGFAREFTVGQAALRLRERGYAIRYDSADIALEDAEGDRLVGEMEGLIQHMGGFSVMARLFASVQSRYEASMQRYQFLRVHQVGTVPKVPLPVGYLVALTAKHLGSPGESGGDGQAWETLASLATDYAAIHDAYEFSPPAFGRPSARELPVLLAKRALYDFLYTLPQLRPDHVEKILRGVLPAPLAEASHGAGWTVGQVLAVIAQIYAEVDDRRGPVSLDLRGLAGNVAGVAPRTVEAILTDVLCHAPEGPNRKFSRPTESTERGADPFSSAGNNLYFRPLIRRGADQAVVLDRSVAGPAFVEAVLAALRVSTGNKNFQSEVVGPGLETLVQALLGDCGIATVTGDYDEMGVDGECDVVVDCGDRLAFIEVKAKALTRNASAGSDVDATLSLAGSVIAAQQQAMGHEIQLRQAGELRLVDKSKTRRATVQWRGQRVERIAVGLFDYGFFQDRTVVAQLLRSVVGGRYSAMPDGPGVFRKGEFKKLNRSLDDLTEHLKAWKELAQGKSDPFSHCWFLSVPQLFLLLEGVKEPDDFFGNLDRVGRLSFQTCNFYTEYQQARMFDATRGG